MWGGWLGNEVGLLVDRFGIGELVSVLWLELGGFLKQNTALDVDGVLGGLPDDLVLGTGGSIFVDLFVFLCVGGASLCIFGHVWKAIATPSHRYYIINDCSPQNCLFSAHCPLSPRFTLSQ